MIGLMRRVIEITIPLLLLLSASAWSQLTLVEMDETQTDHLKAYGLAYWALDEPRGIRVEWLLNYRGGSFLIKDAKITPDKARVMGVSYSVIDHAQAEQIYQQVEQSNMEVVLLEKAPKVALYAPPGKEPWDDAVLLALEYAEIPYIRMWDPEMLAGRQYEYDWLHLHHEDFTGQYGKFYGAFRNAAWYRKRVKEFEKAAQQAGFSSVPEHKLAVALSVADYVSKGGFLFAMCSSTDSIDVALAAAGIDIVPPEIDHTPMTPNAQEKLDYSKSMVFTDFQLVSDPMVYEFSDIDISPQMTTQRYEADEFHLFEFSAKYDRIPTMLTQCHTNKVKDFLGQTTAYRKDRIKDYVVIMGEFPGKNVAKYVHANFGKGTVTFLAGHDPEDYAHMVGEQATELSLHKHSPGYRLILNNILFPAARKEKQKT